MHKKTMCLLVLALGLILTSASHAQVTKSSIRLSVDTNLLDLRAGNWNPEGAEKWDSFNLAFGVGNPNIAFGLGVLLADAFTLGARFTLATDKQKLSPDEEYSDDGSIDSIEETAMRWSILPYIEYAFATRLIRPYIGLTFGFEGEKAEAPALELEKNLWSFYCAGGGGVHIFPTRTFSLDAGLLVGLSGGSGDTIAGENEQKISHLMFRLSLILGVSGWF